MGRRTTYKREYIEQVRKFCLLGATDEDLAGLFGVSRRTILRWSKTHPAFRAARKAGKDQADARVERSLFRRAVGYSHPVDKIFAPRRGDADPVVVPTTKHYPPDPRSMVFWLRNRQPARWRRPREEERDEDAEVTRIERVIVDPRSSDG